MTNLVTLQETNTLAYQAGYFVMDCGISEPSHPLGRNQIPLWLELAQNVLPQEELPNQSKRKFLN